MARACGAIASATARCSASFGDGLKAEKSFAVAAIPGVPALEVYPKTLPLLVGEIADLSIASPSSTPVRISSSKPGIVEVTASNRLIGRAEGTTEVEVAQGSQKSTVEVSVAKAEFASIAIDPGSVVVPVDDVAYPRVVARVKGDQTGRLVELAPDLLSCDKAPSPRYADFNVRRMEFRGVMPTIPSAADAGDALCHHGRQGPGGRGGHAVAAGADPAGPGGPAPGPDDASARLGPL